MTKQFLEGDIIKGSLRGRDQSFHPIVYFGEIDSEYFEGGMITHSRKSGNIRLSDIHFSQKIDNDSRPSFLVKNYLIKKWEWGPFEKIGKLSSIGLKYVQSKLKGSEPQLWEDYV